MRKLMGLKVALLVVCLLTMAAVPATAQLADPLSLAASGVLLPFFDTDVTGYVSILEVAVPVSHNALAGLILFNTSYTSHPEPMSSASLGQLVTAATYFGPLATSTAYTAPGCLKPLDREAADMASFTSPLFNAGVRIPFRPRNLLTELITGLGVVGPLVVAAVTDKLRLQFDFSPDAVKDLDELKEEMGLSSRVDVVKHALGLLQWVMRVRQRGAELLIEEKGEHRVVVLPLLSSSRAASTRRG